MIPHRININIRNISIHNILQVRVGRGGPVLRVRPRGAQPVGARGLGAGSEGGLGPESGGREYFNKENISTKYF